MNPASRIPREDQQVAVEPASRILCEDLLPVILEIQVGLLISRRNLLKLQNHPSALTRLGGGSDLPLGALRGLGHPHHPPLTAHVNARPPSGGGLSNASVSSESGSIGYRDRCPPVPQIKQKFPRPIP